MGSSESRELTTCRHFKSGLGGGLVEIGDAFYFAQEIGVGHGRQVHHGCRDVIVLSVERATFQSSSLSGPGCKRRIYDIHGFVDDSAGVSAELGKYVPDVLVDLPKLGTNVADAYDFAIVIHGTRACNRRFPRRTPREYLNLTSFSRRKADGSS
jgi:hypothetical protein